jgi:hypothetical protein
MYDPVMLRLIVAENGRTGRHVSSSARGMKTTCTRPADVDALSAMSLLKQMLGCSERV